MLADYEVPLHKLIGVCADGASTMQKVLMLLEENHKLPRRIVMTRWLSSMDAVKVMATSRETYKNFFEHETSEPGQAIYDELWNNFIFAWYYCLLDVLPVLTGMNVLFQASLPLPHLLYPKIGSAKQTLIGMVGTGNVLRTEIMPAEAVKRSYFIWCICQQIYGCRRMELH